MLVALELTARVLLAGVLVAAGVAKLADRAGTRRAVVDFGVPEWLATPFALLLPSVEVAVAVLLLPARSASVGALGALGLLLLFSVAIAVSLARGRAPDCHCFGQLHSAPAGWKTLARNGGLAVIAVFALVVGVSEQQRSAVAWVGRLQGPELLAFAVGVAAVAIVGVGAVAFFSLLRSYGRVLLRLDRVEGVLAAAGLDVAESEPPPELGLEPGVPAPAFTVADVAGSPVTLEDLLDPGKPVLLVFTSPHCGPCAALLPEAARWQQEHTSRITVAFACDGSAEEVRSEADEFELEHVLVDGERRLYEAFQASGTPSAVLIAANGTIGSWVAPGSEWIERLVDQALASDETEAGLPVGTAVPELELPSLDGEPVSLSGLQGQETLLLFWNPGCGFCRAMHEDVLAFEQQPDNGHPRLIVISSGDPESTRGERFRSLVLLDHAYAAGGAFGATGTPMAVLLDPDGRIASGVATGADAVLALARGITP